MGPRMREDNLLSGDPSPCEPDGSPHARGQRGKTGSLGSMFHKSGLSKNWGFWIPAHVSGHEDRLFAGMTDLGAIFHALARGVVENRLSMLGIYHR